MSVDEAGVRRFFLHDGTYLGAAGDPVRADLAGGFVRTNTEPGEPTFRFRAGWGR